MVNLLDAVTIFLHLEEQQQQKNPQQINTRSQSHFFLTIIIRDFRDIHVSSRL